MVASPDAGSDAVNLPNMSNPIAIAAMVDRKARSTSMQV